jgi:hypothetical protein
MKTGNEPVESCTEKLYSPQKFFMYLASDTLSFNLLVSTVNVSTLLIATERLSRAVEPVITALLQSQLASAAVSYFRIPK